MNLARSIFACLFIAAFLSGCKLLLPKSFTEAESHFSSRQYDRAITAYQRADQETPNNVHIKQGLIKAYSHKAVALFEEAKGRPTEDVDNKIKMYGQAQSANDSARQYINEVKRIEPLDPNVKTPNSRPRQLLLPVNDEMDYTAKIRLYEKTLQKHKAYVAHELIDEEKKQNEIIDGLKSAVALMSRKPDGPIQAYDAFRPYDKYAAHMTKASKAKNAIEKTAINFYEARGLHFVSKNKFSQANKDFKSAQSINPSSHQATAGILAVQTKKQITKSQFEAAYASLNEINLQHPKSRFYNKHMENVRTQVVTRGLAKAKKHTKTSSITDKALAFDIYHQMQPIAQPSPGLTSRVSLAISALQTQVASDLTARAMVLNQRNAFAYSSNISALLSNAYGFSDKAALPYKQMAYRANQISSEKLALPVLFTTQGKKSKQRTHFRDWLDGEIFDTIPNLDIENVTATDLFDIPEEGALLNRSNVFTSTAIPFEQTEIVFMLNLRKHDFKETGRDRAKRKSSKYVSKRYKIHNNEWDRAKQRLENAKDAHREAKIAAEELYNLCKREASRAAAALGPFGDIAAGGLCSYGTNALTSELSGLNDARAEFSKTPKQIEKKEISRYRYEEYTVQVRGDLVADLIAYDRRNKKTIKLEPIKLSVNKSGKIFKNVKREDVNGLKNGEKDVPEIDAEIEKKEQSVFKHTRAQIAMFLEDHRWKRFCYQGDALTKKRLPHAATDAYSQCINTAPREEKGSKEIIAANKAIQKYMGFNPEMVAKYGSNKDYQSFSNNDYSLSDSELEATRKANTLAFMSQPSISLTNFNIEKAVANFRTGNFQNDSMIASPVLENNTQTVSFDLEAQ